MDTFIANLTSLESYPWLILPLLIFLARILDVSIGTLRIVFVSKGYRNLAPLFGFFEVLVWILVMSQIMQNLSNPMTYLAFALGFATGTWVGMKIEARLSLGHVVLQIITRTSGQELVEALSAKGLGVTSLEAQGKYGPVNLIYTVLGRKKVPQVLEVVNHYNPKAFYTIEEVAKVSDGAVLDYLSPAGLPPRGIRKGR